MNVDQWIPALRSVSKSIKVVEEVLGRMAEVISDTSHLDARSKLIELLNSAQTVLPDCVTKSDEIAEQMSRVLVDLVRGRPLTREQFHLAMALNLLNFTNKSAGVSDFDDYEVYRLFCYEDEERFAIITPSEGSAKPITIKSTFGRRVIKAKPGFAAFVAPEDLKWDCLRPEQREFFEKHYSEIVPRFKHRPG